MKKNIKIKNRTKKLVKEANFKANPHLVEAKTKRKVKVQAKIEAKKSVKPAKEKKKEVDLKPKYFDLIIKPIITEKATSLSQLSKTTFKVAPNANKASVKEAIEKIYGVEVSKVNILNQRPKTKVFKGRIGVRSGYKKAIVTISGTKQIDLTASI
ncbi:MAG: 50S ribosomal protein L23 [Alphaproteobacteria bacterium]|jgi:large subunit ribosomal protein L23